MGNNRTYFFKTHEEKKLTRQLEILVRFNMITEDEKDGLLELVYSENQPDINIVQCLIDSHIENIEQKIEQLKK